MPRLVAALVTMIALAGSTGLASAHCCHDDRLLGSAAQSGLRRGTHGLDRGGLSDEFGQRESIVPRGGEERTGTLSDGGLGQMQGNSVGEYGAGSIGQRGPGGLGALEGNFLSNPPLRRR